MCGRFTFFSKMELIKKILRGESDFDPLVDDWKPIEIVSYNISPSQQIPSILHDPESRKNTFTSLKWGLIPSWTKDLKKGQKPINARSETILENRLFKTPFKKRRCLIITDGFFEWKQLEEKKKQPYFIRMTNHEPFCFAGIWEQWKNGETINTCSIITTTANPLMETVHQRMPVIISRKDYAE